MLKRTIVCVCLVFLILKSETFAQNNTYPVIGKPCPYFYLKNIEDYSRKNISLKDLKGKAFILDFFSTGCTACFASFSKINELNRKFSDQVQIILVGRDDKYIRQSYDVFKKRQNLQIPHAYDTMTFFKFGVNGVPYVIWVDSTGIVTAITSSPSLTASNILAFAQGKPFYFLDEDSLHVSTVSFNRHKPLVLDSTSWGNAKFFQRSLIASWNSKMGNFCWGNVEKYIKYGAPLQIVGWPLSSLYRFAYINNLYGWNMEDTEYYGKYHFAPIYEMKDSSLFEFQWDDEKNMFCYSQILASNKNNPEEMLRIMRDDLHNAFGYEATIETRKMPYLRLIKNEDNYMQLKTKGGDKIEESFIGGVNFKNVPIASLVSAISYKAYLVSKDLPLIDETGLNYPIDINFQATMTDINDIIKELPSHGLRIVPGIKEMKVIVIRDGR